MTQDALEGVNVSAISQVINGEGVAKTVDGGFFDAGTFTDFGDAFEEHVTIERIAFISYEQVLIGRCS